LNVAYIVEGSTDRALLHGLRDRWCPNAELKALGFRGSKLRHRHYPKVCAEARFKEVDVLVLLTDANGRDWRKVKREELRALPAPCPFNVIVGVCDRNVECWICADATYAAQQLKSDASLFNVPDPKGAFEAASGIDRDAKCEERIAAMVRDAPVRNWIKQSPSFRAFYEDARDIAQQRKCAMPNEIEGP